MYATSDRRRNRTFSFIATSLQAAGSTHHISSNPSSSWLCPNRAIMRLGNFSDSTLPACVTPPLLKRRVSCAGKQDHLCQDGLASKCWGFYACSTAIESTVLIHLHHTILKQTSWACRDFHSLHLMPPFSCYIKHRQAFLLGQASACYRYLSRWALAGKTV